MRIITCLMLVLGIASPWAAHGAETPPPGGKPRDFQLVEPETIRLDNGLAATLVPFGDVPKTTILVNVRTGNLNEGGRTWLADLTGELLTQGTASASGSEIAARAASMGGALTVSTGLEQTTLSIDVLEDHAADAVALLAEVLSEPAFPESELERIRDDLERRRSIAVTQPQQIATEAFRGLLYGEHPFGRIIPSADQLAGYGIDDVRGYFEDNFGARRTRVYVGGRFDRDLVADAIREAFGNWTEGPEVFTDIPEPAEGPGFLLVDRPGAQQSTLRLGLPVADPQSPEWTRLGVMNTLLGGFFSSRITSNIREDKGYTYSPRSVVEPHYRDALWVQQADVTSEHTGDSLREILAEITRLQDEAPAEAEMERVRNYLTGTFVLANASRFGILSQLAFVDFHGLDRSFLTGYVDRVQDVTAEQVRATAAEWLPVSEMTLVVVGDPETVSSQLKSVEALKPLLEPGS